jgi:tyrosyl-tRNA synthetase
MTVITDEKKIDEILSRGVHDIFGREELKKKMLSGKQLHVKLGTDVTGNDLHLGHSVIHRKLRDFQELGHRVTLIIGDFTTLTGDHSDKVDMRAETNEGEIIEREKTYQQQFFKTVLEDKTTIRHNSEWLESLPFKTYLKMAKSYSVQQMFDRETFKKRYSEGKTIGLDEWSYPIMQGYDSVVLECDVELGGTDQTFNLLAGRKLMPIFGKEEQSAIAMKLLLGSDGRPMGKSLQNYIPITTDSNDMFGKIMSLIDSVVWDYFELATRVPLNEIAEMKKAVVEGESPMISKKRLAREIITFYHSEAEAIQAQENWEKTFSQKIFPEDAPVQKIDQERTITDWLVMRKKASSKSAARRLIEQGAVKIIRENQEEKVLDPEMIINETVHLKIGPKNFLTILK